MKLILSEQVPPVSIGQASPIWPPSLSQSMLLPLTAPSDARAPVAALRGPSTPQALHARPPVSTPVTLSHTFLAEEALLAHRWLRVVQEALRAASSIALYLAELRSMLRQWSPKAIKQTLVSLLYTVL